MRDANDPQEAEQIARLHEAADISNEDAREVLARIQETLWPNQDLDYPWSPDTIEEIAAIMRAYGLAPRAPDMAP